MIGRPLLLLQQLLGLIGCPLLLLGLIGCPLLLLVLLLLHLVPLMLLQLMLLQLMLLPRLRVIQFPGVRFVVVLACGISRALNRTALRPWKLLVIPSIMRFLCGPEGIPILTIDRLLLLDSNCLLLPLLQCSAEDCPLPLCTTL